MPLNANVFLHYGPYDACSEVAHREDRLEGLQGIFCETLVSNIRYMKKIITCIYFSVLAAVLGGEGHTVNLKQIEDRDVIEIWVNGQQVFTCKIQELDYGKSAMFV